MEVKDILKTKVEAVDAIPKELMTNKEKIDKFNTGVETSPLTKVDQIGAGYATRKDLIKAATVGSGLKKIDAPADIDLKF